jgi:hypothetical protein
MIEKSYGRIFNKGLAKVERREERHHNIILIITKPWNRYKIKLHPVKPLPIGHRTL